MKKLKSILTIKLFLAMIFLSCDFYELYAMPYCNIIYNEDSYLITIKTKGLCCPEMKHTAEDALSSKYNVESIDYINEEIKILGTKATSIDEIKKDLQEIGIDILSTEIKKQQISGEPKKEN